MGQVKRLQANKNFFKDNWHFSSLKKSPRSALTQYMHTCYMYFNTVMVYNPIRNVYFSFTRQQRTQP